MSHRIQITLLPLLAVALCCLTDGSFGTARAQTAPASNGPAQPAPATADGPKWTAAITATMSPFFSAVQHGQGSFDPSASTKLNINETSDWIDLATQIKLKRNESQGVLKDNPATLITPAGAYVPLAWANLHPAPWLSFYAGKIHSRFGIAATVEAGIFTGFGEDYEQAERVGGGVEVTLPTLPLLGEMRLAAESFYADYSSFASGARNVPYNSESGPNYLQWRKGFGPASTGKLDSNVIALRSGSPESGLFWQVSVTNERTGDPLGRSEQGRSASIRYDGWTVAGAQLAPYAEFARINNFNGVAGLTYQGVNAGMDATFEPWTLSFGDVPSAVEKRSGGVAL